MSDLSILQSLIADRWLGARAGAPLSPARSTARAIHHTHAEEIDFGEALDHARTIGVPALLALDFQQRAARLKALAAYLNERKEALYAISRHTGATRSDSWIDIEGGTGTLYAYASMGGNELPSGNVVHEGPAVPLGKKGQLRRHPHPGAARRRRGAHQRLQLPDLGPAREVRADLPRRHAVHRQAGDRDQLPHRGDGAADGRVGPAAAGQPAARHRRHRRPARPARQPGRRHLHRLGRHGAEAARQRATCSRSRSRSTPRPTRSTARSSAPTCSPDDEEFDLFVKEVVREMTVKAGQKCTAIRRAIVPRQHLDAVAAKLRERLAARRPRRPGGRGREDGRAGLAGAAAGRRPSAVRAAQARQRARLRRAARRSRRSARARPTAPSSRRRCCSAATAWRTTRSTTSRRSARSAR